MDRLDFLVACAYQLADTMHDDPRNYSVLLSHDEHLELMRGLFSRDLCAVTREGTHNYFTWRDVKISWAAHLETPQYGVARIFSAAL